MDSENFTKHVTECLALQLANIRRLDEALCAIHGPDYPARILIDALRK